MLWTIALYSLGVIACLVIGALGGFYASAKIMRKKLYRSGYRLNNAGMIIPAENNPL